MKILITALMFSCVVSAGVPANSVTITDLGTGQTDRVFVISRVFAPGKIRGYPKPQIGGSDVSEWQADNKTTWSDGSVQHSIISFKESLTASQVKTITFVSSADACHLGSLSACQAAALDEAGMLVFNGADWNFQFSVMADPVGATTPRTVDARTMVDAASFEYWLRGPVVTEVLVGRTSRTWDFAWDCSANCTGTMSTATWNDGSNKTLHPHFILSFYDGAAGVRGQYIMENAWTDALQDQRYDVVLKSGGDLSTTEFSRTNNVHYARTRWRKEYWSGTAPAGYDETDGQGGRIGYTQDLGLKYLSYSKVIPRMDFTRTVSSSVTADNDVSTGSCYLHEPLAISNCTGGKSGGYQLNFPGTGGRPEIGLMPRWFINYLYTPSNDAYRNLVRQADISGLPPIHYREAHTSKRYEDLDNNGTADGELAFGRPISINARPTIETTSTGNGNVGDRVTILESLSFTGWSVDQAHQGAFATIPYLVTGNHYFLEEVQFWQSLNLGWGNPTNTGLTFGRHGSWGVGSWDSTRGQAWSYIRSGAHAAFFSPDGTPEKRYYTQKLENIIEVFEGMLDVRDGIGYEAPSTNPYNPNTDPSRWHWGRSLKSLDTPATLGLISRWIRCQDLPVSPVDYDATRSFWCDAYFLTHFQRLVWQHVHELGFPATALVRRLHQAYLDWIYDPTFSPYYTEAYNYPLGQDANVTTGACSPTLVNGISASSTSIEVSCVPWHMEDRMTPYVIHFDSYTGERVRICSVSGTTLTACGAQGLGRGWAGTGAIPQTAGDSILNWPRWTSLADLKTGWVSNFQNDTAWNSSHNTEGYAVMARGTAAFLVGITSHGANGDNAHEYLRASMEEAKPESDMNNDPRWAFKPRWDPVRVIGTQIGDTFGIIRYIKPTATDPCTYDGVSDGITNSRYVEFVKTGLTAGTSYSHNIVCAKDPYGDTPVSFTTLATLNGTESIPIRIGTGSATVHIDYGPTSALGSTQSAACTSGCTIMLTDLTKGAYYYRIRRSSGETGAIQTLVVR